MKGMKVALAMALLALAACDLPRDPEDTLETVTGGIMRVGISESPPWTKVGPEGPEGIEVALVEDFAKSLDARIEWVKGTESDLLAALERYELAVVIAGLTRGSPWNGRVALTVPYVTTGILVGLPPNGTIGNDLEGERVAVEPGSAVAAMLREREAIPVPELDPAQAGLPAAAQDWKLQAWNFAPTSFVLAQERHVMAVGPGENAFLGQLERFLQDRKAEIRTDLVAAARLAGRGGTRQPAFR